MPMINAEHSVAFSGLKGPATSLISLLQRSSNVHAFAEDSSVQQLEFMLLPVIHMHGFFFHFENMESFLSILFDLIICLQCLLMQIYLL